MVPFTMVSLPRHDPAVPVRYPSSRSLLPTQIFMNADSLRKGQRARIIARETPNPVSTTAHHRGPRRPNAGVDPRGHLHCLSCVDKIEMQADPSWHGPGDDPRRQA